MMGFDKKGKWVGYDKAEEIWFKNKKELETLMKKYPNN